MNTDMKNEKPILFSGPMVKAIIEGRKTQTRRVVKGVDPIEDLKFSSPDGTRHRRVCSGAYGPWVTSPYGKPGDRLWVKETFQPVQLASEVTQWRYRATDEKGLANWKPSIFCTRKASRITLEIVAVRVERLQDISQEDAIAEGLHRDELGLWTWGNYPSGATNPVYAYELLWRMINGDESWESNPWVWVIEFKKI